MKKKLTEEQIIKILNRNLNGESAKTLCREFGIANATFYAWKKKFADMTVNEAKRFRELEQENSKLKRLVADQALDILMLKDINSKKW